MKPPKLNLRPGHTQIPDQYLDIVMREVSPAEFKVLMAISRQTFGWGKAAEHISLEELMTSTALSNTGVLKSLKVLEDQALIFIKRGNWKEGKKNYYRINLDWTPSELSSPTDKPLSELSSPTPSELSSPSLSELSSLSNKDRETKNIHTPNSPIDLFGIVPLHQPAQGYSKTSRKDPSLVYSGSQVTPTSQGDSKRKKDSKVQATAFPPDFAVTEELIEWALENKTRDPRKHVGAFRDHFLANGGKKADWTAAFRTWMRNDLKFNPRKLRVGDKLPDGRIVEI